MQALQNNPFPMSDKPEEIKPAPASVPMPAPIASQPNPAKAVFVQPAAQPQTTITPKGPLGTIEKNLASLFSRPELQLPDFTRDMIARFLPWLTLMVCFILAPLVLIGIAMGGFLGVITSFYELNTNVFYWLTIIFLIAQLTLMMIAIPKLRSEKRRGWQLIFIASLLSILAVLANIFAQFVQPVIGLMVGATMYVLVTYIIFQVREYYTN